MRVLLESKNWLTAQRYILDGAQHGSPGKNSLSETNKPRQLNRCQGRKTKMKKGATPVIGLPDR
jgi:hypothetical protein